VIALFILACASPRQQSMERVTSSRNATYVSAAEVRAIASRADTAIASDSVARLVSVDGGYNIGVAVVRRQRVGDTTPPDALSHHHITEVYQIIDGSGVFVSGGRVVAGTEMSPASRGVRRIVGPSERGTGIVGGTSVEVGPGDLIVVPPNTPHGFSRLISPQIVYTVVRVDPDRRLVTADAAR
jgi:mannose-6-phosphate isomerase-like protein (cupin superfamily)